MAKSPHPVDNRSCEQGMRAHLTADVSTYLLSTEMASEERIQVFQGTLDLILLRALSTMGAQHAYGLASRLEQIADGALPLNAGTMYAALVRLEQRRWIKGTWEQTPSNRQAKVYAITRAGSKALEQQTGRWNRLSSLMNKLLPGDT